MLGGAGCIGSAVVRHLINYTENSVVNFGKLTYKWYFLTGRMCGVKQLIFGLVMILRRIAGRSGN